MASRNRETFSPPRRQPKTTGKGELDYPGSTGAEGSKHPILPVHLY